MTYITVVALGLLFAAGIAIGRRLAKHALRRYPTCPETHNGVRCTDRPGHRADSCTFPAADR